MTKAILTPRNDQRESTLRHAFTKALIATPQHTKTTGRVFRSLCTPAGLIHV